MTNRKAVSTSQVPPAAGPYSSAIISRGFAFLSGQGPYDAAGTLAGQDIASQTRQTLQNLDAIASEFGATLKGCCRVGVYLTDMDNFAGMNEVYAEFFRQPYPARTTVKTGLPKPEMLVEIDAIIVLPEVL